MPRLFKGRNGRNGRYRTGLVPVPSRERLVTFFTLFSILILYVPNLYRNFGIVTYMCVCVCVYFGITIYKITITFWESQNSKGFLGLQNTKILIYFGSPKIHIVFCNIPKYKLLILFGTPKIVYIYIYIYILELQNTKLLIHFGIPKI